MSEHIRVKHGARWRAEIRSKSDDKLVDSAEGEVGVDEIIGWEYFSLLYNAAGVSGGVHWRHPTTGDEYPGGLSYKLIVPIDPSDLLEGDSLCDCPTCEEAA